MSDESSPAPPPAPGSSSGGTPPEKVIVMARVAIKPAEPAPPAGEDPTEAEHKLKLKSKEPLPWSTSPPVPVFGVLAPVETSPLRKSPAPAVSAPAPVVELPPLLSSFARARPPRIKVDPVAVVISIVGLLVFSGVVYLTYRKHVVGPAVSPPVSTMTPAIAPESTTAINPGSSRRRRPPRGFHPFWLRRTRDPRRAPSLRQGTHGSIFSLISSRSVASAPGRRRDFSSTASPTSRATSSTSGWESFLSAWM